MQISIFMLIFRLFSDQISGEQKSFWGDCLGGAPPMEESRVAYRTGCLKEKFPHLFEYKKLILDLQNRF